MFTIYGGKDAFDQWDKGQRVQNPEMAAGDKVIFLNGCGETHPMKAYTYEGTVVCDVPNDLLRMARPMLIDLCGSREHTTRLMVMPRVKPDDYVYEDNTLYPQESTGSSGGGGLPSGGAPHQMLVTDADGKTVWVERTHYKGQENTILVNEVITTVEDSGMFGGNVTSQNIFLVTAGETYNVLFDGNKYSCTAFDFYAGTVLGNANMMGMGEDTGEPFVVVIAKEQQMAMAVTKEGGEHTIEISGLAEIVHALNPEYIPSMIYDIYSDMDGNSYVVNFDDLYEAVTKSKIPVFLRSKADYPVGLYSCVYAYNNPNLSEGLVFLRHTCSGEYTGNGERVPSIEHHVIIINKDGTCRYNPDDDWKPIQHSIRLSALNSTNLYDITVDANGNLVTTQVTFE